MVQVKSAEADRFVEDPGGECFLFLLYGPDSGLVSERADKIAANSGVDLADSFAFIRLEADDAANDGRLAEEADTISMFGGSRLIRVTGQTRRNLAGVVKLLLDNPPVDCRIVIESGDLKRDSALRRNVEKSRSGVAIPCYPDGPRELDRLISSEIGRRGLSIDPDARQLFASFLGGDRRASRQEIEKLSLYCMERETVTVDDVLAIVGDSSALAISDLVDLVISGDAGTLSRQLDRLIESGESPDIIMLFALRLFQVLQTVRYQVARGKPAREAVGSLRPPLHFSRRDVLLSALPRWPLSAISAAIARLDEAMFECRRNPALAASLADRTLLSLALQARASKS